MITIAPAPSDSLCCKDETHPAAILVTYYGEAARFYFCYNCIETMIVDAIGHGLVSSVERSGNV